MREVDEARIHKLRHGPDRTGPVIYWMSRDQRAEDNWALLYAQQEALRRRAALAVVFCLVPSFLDATDRHFAFMLQGLAETAQTLAGVAIPCFCLKGEPGKTLPDFVAASKAALLITDFDPLRIKAGWCRQVAKAVDCLFVEVDAHNIVPCRFVSDKQEFAARTIRPKIHKQLQRFLVDLPRLRKHPFGWVGGKQPTNGSAVFGESGMPGAVSSGWALSSGAKAADACLHGFLSGKLAVYDTARNDPNQDGQSNLSPYLHFGQISAQRVALEVKRAGGEGTAAFIEELIVRRELSDNYCLHNPDYDKSRGFADWAGKTLAEHAEDKREHRYTAEQFESAKTHDPLWNAAQMEMVKTGKMHGYLRMYWGKKILEWTPSVEEAMEIALRLNNTYELDGRDPNGYAGVAWCIGGVHDRAWPSHPVFGKIRYMNANGCRRKFDVEAYIRRVRDIPA
jgi:deoxyribodipyrimidine photo-lyase